MTNDERNELMQIVRELSYEERDVTLASGRKSNFYFDGKQTCLHRTGGLRPCLRPDPWSRGSGG